MKSPKSPKNSAPTTPDLRAKDLMVQRAEIDHFRQKIVEKCLASPQKAAAILTEWVNKKASTHPKKAA
jgi:hypothetical protein